MGRGRCQRAVREPVLGWRCLHAGDRVGLTEERVDRDRARFSGVVDMVCASLQCHFGLVFLAAGGAFL